TSRQPAGYTPNTAITYWNILSEVPLPVLSDDVRQILQSGRPLEKKEIARVADETATFYHNSYNEQLYWSPVYRLIGQKMLHIYPSLACAEGHRPWVRLVLISSSGQRRGDGVKLDIKAPRALAIPRSAAQDAKSVAA
ncbi:hypothetical protein BaRGS_00027474, partial [Batillaria attramentaria]